MQFQNSTLSQFNGSCDPNIWPQGSLNMKLYLIGELSGKLCCKVMPYKSYTRGRLMAYSTGHMSH